MTAPCPSLTITCTNAFNRIKNIFCCNDCHCGNSEVNQTVNIGTMEGARSVAVVAHQPVIASSSAGGGLTRDDPVTAFLTGPGKQFAYLPLAIIEAAMQVRSTGGDSADLAVDKVLSELLPVAYRLKIAKMQLELLKISRSAHQPDVSASRGSPELETMVVFDQMRLSSDLDNLFDFPRDTLDSVVTQIIDRLCYPTECSTAAIWNMVIQVCITENHFVIKDNYIREFETHNSDARAILSSVKRIQDLSLDQWNSLRVKPPRPPFMSPRGGASRGAAADQGVPV